jgi:hypothetical protein
MRVRNERGTEYWHKLRRQGGLCPEQSGEPTLCRRSEDRRHTGHASRLKPPGRSDLLRAFLREMNWSDISPLLGEVLDHKASTTMFRRFLATKQDGSDAEERAVYCRLDPALNH